jgi:hypothetical protein
MWTRRETVLGGALTFLLAGAHDRCSAAGGRASHSVGCRLADADFDAIYPAGTDTRAFITGNEPMIPKSGDADFDSALAQTLAKISEAFGTLPGFAYYDDSDSLNAYATDRSRLNRADGTVLMGINLLHRLRKSPDYPEVGVAAVCSHEFGHILQYRYGLFDKVDAGQSTIKRSELQADYFAGYFAGLRKKERPIYPAGVAAMTQFDFGDTSFANPSHHGTPDERAAAVVRGFEACFLEGKSLGDAIQESTTYVMRL